MLSWCSLYKDWYSGHCSDSVKNYVLDKSDRSVTRARRIQHECNSCNMSATRVKNFDFDNHTSKNIFLHRFIYYMENCGAEVLWLKLLHNLIQQTGFAQVQILLAACWKFARVRISDNGPDGNKAMPFVSQPYHKNFIWRTTFWKCLVSMPKCIYKMHHKNHKKFFNNVAPFSIKTILCENTNILFSKSHWKLGKMNARFWKNK